MISKNQIKWVRQLEMKKFRQREGLFVAEGPKVVGDLLACGYMPQQLFATPEWKGWNGADGLPGDDSRRFACEEWTEVNDEELRRLSFLQHPQQVLAVFPIPQSRSELQGTRRLSLVLDGVQDPGNLGTIIRMADWFGIDTIYCSPETADAWNPKVVQATMGSIARVNIIYINIAELLGSTTLPVYGTLLDGENIYEQELGDEGFIVMGNEGNGISPSVRPLVTRKLLIPAFSNSTTSRAESLNVAIATAIVCSEFRRRVKK